MARYQNLGRGDQLELHWAGTSRPLCQLTPLWPHSSESIGPGNALAAVHGVPKGRIVGVLDFWPVGMVALFRVNDLRVADSEGAAEITRR